ncbi:hypothetical protein [Oceanicola sp. 502str15]|uniref:hypothetical protein n=1 Tax=Oceanicola sp. 502str15 TaxID=2696061 RepID=UPI002094375E|nr:hypothetical protein [Oceanicola sp. 502str15]MCO6382774.1 hypothetical protein [Oceanicola sp. 502str15]
MKCFMPFALAVLLAALPMPAAAEGLGRITAYVDGVARGWHTISMEQGGARVATASLLRGPRLTELRVQGHPEPRFSVRDVFSLEVRWVGAYAPGAVPLSVDVIHVPEGMGGPFWTSRGARRAAVVDVVELEVWGGYGRLVATFEAELCRKPIISSAVDPETCRMVTGVVETEISVE